MAGAEATPEQRQQVEEEVRAETTEVLKSYGPQWQRWAQVETLRRRTIARQGDVVLCKGSRGTRVEKALERFMAN